MANDFDKTPYPYPPKKWLLTLLDLGPDATKEEYHAAFEKKVTPLIVGGNSAAIKRLMATIQRDAPHLTYDEAWSKAKLQAPSIFVNPPRK